MGHELHHLEEFPLFMESLRIVLMGKDFELRLVSLVVRARELADEVVLLDLGCLLYTSPSPRDRQKSRMPSSA